MSMSNVREINKKKNWCHVFGVDSNPDCFYNSFSPMNSWEFSHNLTSIKEIQWNCVYRTVLFPGDTAYSIINIRVKVNYIDYKFDIKSFRFTTLLKKENSLKSILTHWKEVYAKHCLLRRIHENITTLTYFIR